MEYTRTPYYVGSFLYTGWVGPTGQTFIISLSFNNKGSRPKSLLKKYISSACDN